MNDDGSAPARQELIAQYKTILSRVLDTRPSGTRQHLAQALGKHRSFISQIANPAYATPIPAEHLETIFTTCHFSTADRTAFLERYRQAHPGRMQLVHGVAAPMRTVSLKLPDFGEKLNEQVDKLLADFIATFSGVAQIFASPDETEETE
jgi:hypothetical protein